MKPSYFLLDLVRFGAALLVMFFHLTYQGWLANPSDPINIHFRDDLRAISPVFSSGWVGVPIFFVLSGFVIAFSADGKTAGQFIRGRISRLYPAAWICATLTASVISSDPLLVSKYFRSLSLMPIGPWIDPVYWTLAIEIVFYSIVAAVLATWGSNRLTQAGIILGTLSSFFWLLRLADFAFGHHFRPIFGLFEGPIGGLFLVTHGCFFALGIILWSIGHKGHSRSKVAALALCVIACLVSTAASARFHILEHQSAEVNLLVAPALWIFAVSIIAVATFIDTSRWPELQRAQRWCRFVGLATYPIYLLHNVIGLAVMRALQPLGTPLALAIAIVVILLMSFLVVHLERYPRQLLLVCFRRLLACPHRVVRFEC